MALGFLKGMDSLLPKRRTRLVSCCFIWIRVNKWALQNSLTQEQVISTLHSTAFALPQRLLPRSDHSPSALRAL